MNAWILLLVVASAVSASNPPIGAHSTATPTEGVISYENAEKSVAGLALQENPDYVVDEITHDLNIENDINRFAARSVYFIEIRLRPQLSEHCRIQDCMTLFGTVFRSGGDIFPLGYSEKEFNHFADYAGLQITTDEQAHEFVQKQHPILGIPGGGMVDNSTDLVGIAEETPAAHETDRKTIVARVAQCTAGVQLKTTITTKKDFYDVTVPAIYHDVYGDCIFWIEHFYLTKTGHISKVLHFRNVCHILR